MSDLDRYRVSFHVSHPKLSAADVVASIGLSPRYARSIGDARRSKSGTDLGGSYSQTDVSFSLSDSPISNNEVSLTNFLNLAIDRLPKENIERLTSHGRCFFLVGIYSEGNLLLDFEAKLLSKLSTRNIGLKLDFYSGPDLQQNTPTHLV